MHYHSDHRGTDACCAHCSRAECSVPCDLSCTNTDKQNSYSTCIPVCKAENFTQPEKKLSCLSISNSDATLNSLDETSHGIHTTF